MTATPLSLEVLAAVLGWALVLNIGLMVFTAVLAKAAPGLLHGSQRMWFPQLTDRDIDLVVYGYMAAFKIVVLVFNAMPYFAIRIVLSR